MSTKDKWMRDHNLLLGRRYGRLTVVSLNEAGSNASYNVRCDCGTEKIMFKRVLTRGHGNSCGCAKFKPAAETSFKKVLWTYKKGACTRNLNFDLTPEQVKYLTKQDCYYCGIEPSSVCKTTKYQPDYIYNGIDRVDNSIGYTLENCVPCCKLCNNAKTDLTVEEFKGWIKRLVKHNGI